MNGERMFNIINFNIDLRDNKCGLLNKHEQSEQFADAYLRYTEIEF